MDKDLRNPQLSALHVWLNENIRGYVALCEAGSATSGDPWHEGISDRDITIVVEKLDQQLEAKLQDHLAVAGFNDTYLFIVFSKTDFLSTTSGQDLSSKFRGLTLFGEDVVAQKELPSREFAADFAMKGLGGMARKFHTRLMNSGYWSNEHLKKKLYPEFKRLFVYLGAQHYADTGDYPRNRMAVARAIDAGELLEIAELLVKYPSASKGEVISATKSAIAYLDRCKLLQ